MQTKQEHVDNLNLLMIQCWLQLCLCLFFTSNFDAIYEALYEYTYRRKSHIDEHYTRHDYPMENTDK